MFCPKCGTKNEDIAAFCATCGAELLDNQPPLEAVPPAPAQKQPNLKYPDPYPTPTPNPSPAPNSYTNPTLNPNPYPSPPSDPYADPRPVNESYNTYYAPYPGTVKSSAQKPVKKPLPIYIKILPFMVLLLAVVAIAVWVIDWGGLFSSYGKPPAQAQSSPGGFLAGVGETLQSTVQNAAEKQDTGSAAEAPGNAQIPAGAPSDSARSGNAQQGASQPGSSPSAGVPPVSAAPGNQSGSPSASVPPAAPSPSEIPAAETSAPPLAPPKETPFNSQRVTVRKSGNGWILEFEAWDKDAWVLKLQAPAYVGKNGTSTDTREGDHKSPAGTFNILFCYGLSQPETNLKFRKIGSGDIFVDDASSPYYNVITNSSQVSSGTSREKVYEQLSEGTYTTCIFFDFNGDGENANTSIGGHGSVRTLRGKSGDLQDTLGDIDISSGDMKTLLSYLDSSMNPIITIE